MAISPNYEGHFLNCILAHDGIKSIIPSNIHTLQILINVKKIVIATRMVFLSIELERSTLGSSNIIDLVTFKLIPSI